ncbi:hypothetical protein J3R04_000682 [Spirilliplanes yamanashiensis]|nr:hypothetical protein [Spirilliplanes yamanashiensis]
MTASTHGWRRDQSAAPFGVHAYSFRPAARHVAARAAVIDPWALTKDVPSGMTASGGRWPALWTRAVTVPGIAVRAASTVVRSKDMRVTAGRPTVASMSAATAAHCAGVGVTLSSVRTWVPGGAAA